MEFEQWLAKKMKKDRLRITYRESTWTFERYDPEGKYYVFRREDGQEESLGLVQFATNKIDVEPK